MNLKDKKTAPTMLKEAEAYEEISKLLYDAAKIAQLNNLTEIAMGLERRLENKYRSEAEKMLRISEEKKIAAARWNRGISD